MPGRSPLAAGLFFVNSSMCHPKFISIVLLIVCLFVLTTGSKSKSDGRLTMWWKGIITNSRKEAF